MRDGRVWLPRLGERESVILQMRGRTRLWHPEPRLEVEGAKGVERHHVGLGSSGWFEFVLDAALDRGATRSWLRLRGQGFEMDPGSVELLACTEQPECGECFLVVAPHPDDAEIAAYGLYGSHPKESWVITLTCGEVGSCPRPDEDDEMRTARARVRVVESVEIPQAAGLEASRVGNMLLPDGELERLIGGERQRARIAPGLLGEMRTRFAGTRWPDALMDSGAEAEVQLMKWLEVAGPGIVVAPHWLDTHPDHRASAVLVARALRRMRSPPRVIYTYFVHPPYSELEPLGPAGGPGDPPALLADGGASGFYVHPLDGAMQRKKRRVLAGISDLQGSAPRSPTSFLRRAVRREEWFEVFATDVFVQKAMSG